MEIDGKLKPSKGGTTPRRTNKYLTLKLQDIDNFLTERQKKALMEICWVIREKRLKEGKRVNTYIVVNENEPYAEVVWSLIRMEEERQRGKGPDDN